MPHAVSLCHLEERSDVAISFSQELYLPQPDCRASPAMTVPVKLGTRESPRPDCPRPGQVMRDDTNCSTIPASSIARSASTSSNASDGMPLGRYSG